MTVNKSISRLVNPGLCCGVLGCVNNQSLWLVLGLRLQFGIRVRVRI